MAHDIDFSTGDPAMAYAGDKPWHRLGEKLKDGQPIEVWLKAARLEWELKRLPVQFHLDGKFVRFENVPCKPEDVSQLPSDQAMLDVVSRPYLHQAS